VGGKLVAIGNRKQEAVEGVEMGSGVKVRSGVKAGARKMEKKKNGTPVVRKQ
jgi:hypothetical protein